nr:type I-E CRISPR-associated protein Cas5/CasD [Propionibacterium sp.]
MPSQTLALRLAGPLQAWGTQSQFNRRATDDRPSKAGIVGLLAAAAGRRRGEDVTDLLALTLGVRVDQPGVPLADYHTVSTLDSGPLPSANVNAKGWQVPTSPKKLTHVTRRDYLQDAVFVACVGGDEELLAALAQAVTHPRFPLALGRRGCPPTQPLLIPHETGVLWPLSVGEALRAIPWQAGWAVRADRRLGASVTVSATVDDNGDSDDLDVVADVPVSFDQRRRGYTSRRVRHFWVTLATGLEPSTRTEHDPFTLLGW